MEQKLKKKYNWFVDYFKIGGRITRKQYILRILGRYLFFYLAVVITFSVTALLHVILFDPFFHIFNILSSDTSLLSLFLVFVFLILFIIFKCAQEIKRLHDMNYSGWFILIGFIPLINIVYHIVLIFKEGTIGQNKYGSDPKNRIVYAEEFLK